MWGPNVQDTLKTHEEKRRQLKQASQGTCAAAASSSGAESQARRDLGLEVAEPATKTNVFRLNLGRGWNLEICTVSHFLLGFFI